MFQRVEIVENMKNDEELKTLLDEIPYETSRNIHHNHHPHRQHNNTHRVGLGHGLLGSQKTQGMYGMCYDDPSCHYKNTCVSSPVSGLSLHSDGSSSTLCSGGNSFSDNGSPTPPPLEEPKPHTPLHYSDGVWSDYKIPDSPVRTNTNESLIDEPSLCRNFSEVYIGDVKEQFLNSRDFLMDRDRRLYRDCSFSGSNQINTDEYGDYSNVGRGFSSYMGFQSPVPLSSSASSDGQRRSTLSGLRQEYERANSLGLRLSPRHSDNFLTQFDYCNSSMKYPRQKTNEQTGKYYLRGSPVSNLTTSLSGLPMVEALFYARQDGTNLNEEKGILTLANSTALTNPRPPHLSVENMLPFGLPLSSGRAMISSNLSNPHVGLGSVTGKESFIFQGQALNHAGSKGFDRLRGQSKGAWHEIGASNHVGRTHLDGPHQSEGICDNARSTRICCPFSLPPSYNSLSEAQGFIYLLAKDQHGCRFLQRIFDGSTPKEVQIVFNEIIDHVAELMMNPFGNYLMQKFLDVCNEEQRKQILLKVTEEPGQLVRISLDPHGTRVVQKVIETLKTKHEISLVISALERGFLALVKDLNGNHVVQRCLQCLSIEHNKFIFVAAAKYCVDLGTHQHGCCVLQRCISHSTGELQENLVAEISANGLLLAQDAYGNYVVQFILELRIPSATSKLISQFEGNYVNLSTQKFSSHVVEKCLDVFTDEIRSRIIYELLSVSHFEQLLQHPHANYVVQTAVRVSEGPAHNLLVEEIESHKAISRNSPYSKKIFSQKLLKK